LLHEFLASSFGGLGIAQAIGISVVVFLAALLRGYAGFGSSLLMVPVLALALGPKTAVAIGVLLEGVATLMLVPASFKHVNRKTFRTMGAASVIGIPLGQLALTSLDPSVTNVCISAAVTMMAALVWKGAALRLPRGTATQVGVGAASGFLTGFGSIGGPPLVLYILSGSDAAVRKRADVIAIAGVSQGLAIVSLIFFRVLTPSGMVAALLLAPIFYFGGVIGARLFSRSSDRAYQRLALAALLVSAVFLMLVNVIRLLS
jgi:uncharacterized membrane protein YfcA